MRPLAAALAAVTLVRLVVAATVPLAPDETYYWVWSHALATGYLDHPPMVALWIRAGTAAAGTVRIGRAAAGSARGGAGVLDAVRRRASAVSRHECLAWSAAMLLNASLLLGVGTVIMTPDSPLLFFWTAAFWADGAALPWVGPACGGWLRAWPADLALDSKYTALFLWVGVGLWVLAGARRPALAAAAGNPGPRAPSGWRCSRRCCAGTPRTAGPVSPGKVAASTIGARLGRSAFSPNWLAARSA